MPRTEADVTYLEKAKKLPFYGFDLYEMKDSDERDVLIGLREQSLCLMNSTANERFAEPVILSEYVWSDLRYCTHSKRRVRIGVFSSGNAREHVLKVKGKNCCLEVERLFKDIVKYREAFLGRSEEMLWKGMATAKYAKRRLVDLFKKRLHQQTEKVQVVRSAHLLRRSKNRFLFYDRGERWGPSVKRMTMLRDNS